MDDLDIRTHALNDATPSSDGSYVLVWLREALRGRDNPVIDAALGMAIRADRPVLVFHGLREDASHASDRLHTFILQATRDMARDLAERGIACVQHVERPRKSGDGLVKKLAADAVAVFTDDVFLRAGEAKALAGRATVPVLAIDVARLVPTRHLPTALKTTPAFRKAHTALREMFEATTDAEVTHSPYVGPLPFTPDRIETLDDAQIVALVARCRIDHTLPASTDHPGTRATATGRLDALAAIVARYRWTRNTPSLPASTARLSPYMHYGVVGPREVVRIVREAELHASARWKFLDELLTWREHAHWLVHHGHISPRYDDLPASARATLEDHADDPRDLLPLDALLHGETPDETWNAAQRQWLTTGWMHNNLRMYWGKQLLRWTPGPREAWATACWLNDRLSLDGRDPATYAGLHWCFGGGKRGYRELPVYGWVAPKSDRALRKREGMEAWLTEWATKDASRVSTKGAEETMRALYL